MTACTVLRPGLLTTVQDLGRWGYQDRGVPVAGPMDAFSHRLANRLVGNDDQAAALEVTLVGPELRASGELLCAVTGALFEVFVDERRVECGRPFRVESGATLRFGRRLAGARSTLAFRGGIDVPPVLGSRATSLVSSMGPFGGRALVAGDIVPIGRPREGSATARGSAAASSRRRRASARHSGPARDVLRSRGARAVVFRALHRHHAVEPDGIPARGP